MKAKRIIGIAVAVLLGLMVLLGILSNFITDYWWFNSQGLSTVFWRSYSAEYTLWMIGFVFFLVFINVNLSISLRSSSNLTADPRFEKLLETFGKFIRYFVYGGAVVLAFIMAGMLSNNWMEFLSFTNAEPYPMSDPIFGKNVGFYIFSLPFIIGVKNWLLGVVIVTFIGTVLVYLIRQGVSFAVGRVSISDKARKHIAILIGVFFLLLAFGYWLDRFDVLYSSRSESYFGAGYTDVFAQIPGAWVMMVVSLLTAVLLVQSLFSKQIKRAGKIIAGFIVLAVLSGAVIPGVIQKFVVNPTEQSKELPYIKNNIAFTRMAYDLTRIVEKEIKPKYDLNYNDITADSATIRNIMLWDYRPLASTLDQLQVIRLYYDFPDVDIDRYRLPDGTYRQVMLGARELNQDKLPANAKTWVNMNLVYTHGYGLGMSPVNVVTEEGLPEFFIKDIPPVSDAGLTVSRPEIYFGEKTTTPVIIDGSIEEFDYPLGDANKMTKYQESAGVGIGSLLRRLVFAMHFGDLNMLISGYMSPQSRILYYRTIQERVRKIAPYLTFDDDPYLVAAYGRLYWIYDAYTTSRMFPYSKPHEDFNYIRNSVKIVIDAYNGETKFYRFNEASDPMIRVYEKIFPDLFSSQEKIPDALRGHIRYPQDLFDIQSSIFETYHMEDPQVFYNKEDLWNIANEKLQESATKMESYYAIMRLPNEPKEEFIQMIPYTPNKRDNMIAWLCARSDGDNYGTMLVYKFPKQDLTYGPMQVSARIDQDPNISQQLTLWNQQGSSVTRGNLLVIPIKEEVMYVQPVYLQATSGKLPELKRVIVSYGNRIAMETSLDQALADVFKKDAVGSVDQTKTSKVQSTPTPSRIVSVSEQAKSAMSHYLRAERAMKEGDWSKYGEELKLLKQELEGLVRSTGK